jgi:hypothetical protein
MSLRIMVPSRAKVGDKIAILDYNDRAGAGAKLADLREKKKGLVFHADRQGADAGACCVGGSHRLISSIDGEEFDLRSKLPW